MMRIGDGQANGGGRRGWESEDGLLGRVLVSGESLSGEHKELNTMKWCNHSNAPADCLL